MPEEKVSLPCYADETTGVTIHRGGCGECAPAADAGPRCTVCQAPIYYSSLTGWSHYNSQSHAAAPPVPQEAAPHRIADCGMDCPDINPSATVAGHNNFTATDTQALPLQPATAPDWAMRQDEPLKALRQWEADTEAPANASEGNAFIDGFNAGREAGSERERDAKLAYGKLFNENCANLGRIDELTTALNSLKCEVTGWLGMARPMLVQELSVTNVRVMEHHVAEASRLLGGESK